jgi:hypothetical protein
MSLSAIVEIIIFASSQRVSSSHCILSIVFKHFTLTDLFATTATTRTSSLSLSPTCINNPPHPAACKLQQTGLPKSHKPFASLGLSTRFQRRLLQNLNSGEANASHLPHRYRDPASRIRNVRDQVSAPARVNTQSFGSTPLRSPGPSFFSCSVRTVF